MKSFSTLALVLALATSSIPAAADDTPSPEAIGAAKELLALVSPDLATQFTSQMTATFWPQVEEQARASKIDDQTLAAMRSAFEQIQRKFIQTAMADAPPVYARHFTIAELHDLTAFYRSPTGSKALRELPQVMGDLAGLIVPRLPTAQQEISAEFDRILKEHGYPK